MDAGKTILLTGADGLLGRALASSLLERGYTVHALSRRKNRLNQYPENPRLQYFYWNVECREIDEACLRGVEAIIHLAGESIGAGRWTVKRRKAIRDSRIESISLIYDLLGYPFTGPGSSGAQPGNGISVRVVVSASATGYYEDSADRILFEGSPASDGFLGRTCRDWEAAVTKGGERLGIRTVCMRSGVVLSKAGGMYAKLRPSTAMGLGVIAGSGRQYLPWIHIRDAVDAYIFALENEQINGAYNMVAPDQITLAAFMHNMAKGLGKPLWLPLVPAWLLRLALGQMSELLLYSIRASSSRLEQAGFVFAYGRIEQAILELESGT